VWVHKVADAGAEAGLSLAAVRDEAQVPIENAYSMGWG